MKGIVFNLVERVVTDAHGGEVWDDLLDEAGVEGSYTSLGSYPDEELDAVVAAGAARLGMAPGAVLREVARSALPLMAEAYPVFFTAHRSTRPFLLTLNEIIHPEVLKLYPGAYTPSFTFAEPQDGSLVMGYHSKRSLCMFAEGLVLGAGDYYGEQVAISRPVCRHRGDAECVLVCRFDGAERPG